MKKSTKKTKEVVLLEEILERVKRLEDNKIDIPYKTIVFPPPNPNLHYHGTTACYNNPCFWA